MTASCFTRRVIKNLLHVTYLSILISESQWLHAFFRMKQLLAISFIILLITGCTHVVSKETRDMSGKGIQIPLLFNDPDAYKGDTVILGGDIVISQNTPEGTYIEVVQKPLDYRGRPVQTDRSQGRFLVLHEGFLDNTIYSRGRYVTVAGVVQGRKVRPLGDTDYSYLFIKSREIHLVQPGERFPVRFGVGIFHVF